MHSGKDGQNQTQNPQIHYPINIIKVLLVKRNRLLCKGKIQQANILAEKIGRLMSRLRS